MIDRKPIFDAVRTLRLGKSYTQSEVNLLDAAIDVAIKPLLARIPPQTSPPPPLILVPAKPELPSTIDKPVYILSAASLAELDPVHPILARCVKRAIGYSLVDFRVNQGERTLAEQRDAFRRGTTRTMKSKHLKQPDGTVWAVDLVAIVNGKVSWDFDYYYYIARAMDRAATELGVADHIRWGCVWDRVLSDFGVESEDKEAVRKGYLRAIEEYKKRHAGSDFLDGPHFEWVP